MAKTLNSAASERELHALPGLQTHPVLLALGQALNVRLYVYDQGDGLIGAHTRDDASGCEFPSVVMGEARRAGTLVYGVTPGGCASAAAPLLLSKSGGTLLIVSEQEMPTQHLDRLPDLGGAPAERPPEAFRQACEQVLKAMPQVSLAADELEEELWVAWRQQLESSLVRMHEDRRPFGDLLSLVAHQACKTLNVSASAVAVWDRASQAVLGSWCTDEDPRRRQGFQALLEAFTARNAEASAPEEREADAASWPLVFGLELKGSYEGLLLLRPADIPGMEEPGDAGLAKEENIVPPPLGDKTALEPEALSEAMTAVSSALQFRGRHFAAEVSQALLPCLRNSGQEEDDPGWRWSHEDIRSFFSNLGLALSSALDLKGLLRVIVEHAVRLTHSDGGSLYLISDNQVVVEARTGFEEPRPKTGLRVGERFLQSARGLVSVLTGEASSPYRNGSSAWPGQVGAHLGVPLVYQADVVGLLNLYVREKRPYTQDDVELLAAFTSHATLAIENARAFEFEQRRAQEVTLLFLAARAIGQCQSLSEVMEVGADQMTRVSEVNRCLIMLLDTAGREFYTAASLGLSEDQLEFFSYYRMGLLELEPRFMETLNRGKIYLFTSAPSDCPPLQKLFNLLPSSSAMLVPLLAQDSLLGLIWLDDTRIAHGFTTAQSRLVQALAIHLGTAIHRARLLEQMEGNLRQIKALYDVSTALAGTFTPSRVDEVIVQKAFELMGQCPCALMAFDENTKNFELTAHMALPPALQNSDVMRLLAGPALKSKKTLLAAIEGAGGRAESTLEARPRVARGLPRTGRGSLGDVGAGLVRSQEGASQWLKRDTADLPEPPGAGHPGEEEGSVRAPSRPQAVQAAIDLLGREHFHTYMSIPLLAKRRVVGAITFLAQEGYEFPDEETQLVHSFANQVAIAIEGSRLHMVVRNKVRELATLFEVGKAVTGSLRLDQVLEALGQNVRTATSSDAVSIMLLDAVQQEMSVNTVVGLSRQHRRTVIKVGEGVAGQAAHSGRVMALHDSGAEAERFPSSVRGDGMKTILAVPMKARGRVIGLLNVYRATIYHHTQSEINLLTTLANQAAIAIENARLYEEKNQVTQILREILIPQTRFVHEGVEVGHRFQSSMELSGDYYDTEPLQDGRVAITIADVSGKGPTAATYALRTKYIVRSYTLAGYTPARVLAMTNPMISADAGPEMFISLFHAQVDMQRRVLTYASGGHEPALFWSQSSQTARLLPEGGLLLGVDPTYPYEETALNVDPGDLLILYTDGVTECRNEAGEGFGVGRIQEIVEQYPTLGSQALANKIFSSVLRFCSKRMHDDFSLLVVRF